MIIVLSPAKTLDEAPAEPNVAHSQPELLDDARMLVDQLATLSVAELSGLMSISDKLAELNHRRYQQWSCPFAMDNARQALLAFKGDVYTGFDLVNWRSGDYGCAQKTIRILSGLYGILRPLDLMQPYRLEMGTGLVNSRGKDLYAFWGDRITRILNRELESRKGRSRALINLASVEYFKAVEPGNINAPVISPVFKDEKRGTFKIISFYAKKARGMMADFIVRNRITDPSDLRAFNVAGYCFDAASSSELEPVFLRTEEVAQAAAA
jgi:cytoplasmic iron level regulating protein YaaA (DUF328/UPF0246 family)